jgi:hypothetical protein
MLRIFSILAMLLLLGAACEAREIKLHVVDADSGAPLVGVKVTRFYCEYMPFDFLIPKSCWTAMETVYSDAAGCARIEKPAGSDYFFVVAEGYCPVAVCKKWFHYEVLDENHQGPTAECVDGAYVIPLHRHTAH